MDYYYTHFENQVVVDIERFNELRFYNLSGQSFAHSFQTELAVDISERLDVKGAYKWHWVRNTFNGSERFQPMLPLHRALVNAAYATPYDKWKFDITGNFVGAARLPQIAQGVGHKVVRGTSDPYLLFNAQVTRSFKKWNAYVGVENLANYMQPHPIIDAQNPFGEQFDAALIWGPVQGRIFYAGLRWTLKRKE